MRTIRVSAAVIKDGDKILAAERGYGEYKGFWEFPGGKREERESGEAAAVREIREELQAEISIDRLLCTVEHQYNTFYLIMDCYLAHIVSGRLTITEHEALKWLSKDEIGLLEWLPADLKALPLILPQI